MATKFFHQLKTPLQVFLHMRAPKRNNEAERELTLTFRIALDGNIIRSAPPFVVSAYEETKKGATKVELDREIDKLDVFLFNLPEHKKPSFKLPALHLQSLTVKKVKNSEGDTATVLTFQAEYPYDDAVWEYLGDHYASDVWAKLDSAQAELVDIEAEAAKDKANKKSRSLEFPPAANGEDHGDEEEEAADEYDEEHAPA